MTFYYLEEQRKVQPAVCKLSSLTVEGDSAWEASSETPSVPPHRQFSGITNPSDQQNDTEKSPPAGSWPLSGVSAWEGASPSLLITPSLEGR